ncbi:hypothetical protein GNP84_18990 [Aliivibrio fischeri]|uniref:hypothetical protein n=1 Tax=Aliivibrio fischeri TaxID=668 RepID=UPI0012D949FC|nr:hypothetical protein [Aliivibrio fischeri]MUK78969.1 hypothetical protein [Aliivibrio fischeri]
MERELVFVGHPREVFARTQVMTYSYMSIAESEYSNSILIDNADNSNFDEFELDEQSKKATAHALKAIVFSAMCIEAAINDYAGTHLGDKYFETHLCNLDVVSKWVVIPKLVCGKEINKSSAAFGALKQLIRSRNQLVHSKSRELNSTNPKLMEQIEAANIKFESDFNNSLKAVYLLAMEMDNVIGIYNPIRIMDRASPWFDELAEPAKALFDECKKIVTKNNS